MQIVSLLLAMVALTPGADPADASRRPLVRTVDLNLGESSDVVLADGSQVTVKLLSLDEERDALRSAVRRVTVQVEINGLAVTLESGNYHLPRAVAGVQIDCPVTKGYYQKHDPFEDSWGLEKDARFRMWPAGSPWTPPGTFVYPLRQRWFASSTQMGNEPSYVDGGDFPSERTIYYHSGLDLGGCEGLAEIVSATDGLVVSSGGHVLADYPDLPYYTQAQYDTVYILDEHGWFYRYAHLKTIDAAIQPGRFVTAGQKLGLLGKEGGSGGWAHLHFDVKSRQPSGKWGIQEGYAFLWEAYQREHGDTLRAVARPHHLIAAGDTVTLNGSRSNSATSRIARFEWTFGDGTTARGETVQRTYDRPGSYSEILKVVDEEGQVDHDFAIVQVLDNAHPDQLPPTIHAAYAPTFGLLPGDPVTFKVRTFRTTVGSETWDFGDGSEPVEVQSDGNANSHASDGYAQTVHRFAKPGQYVVRVSRTGHTGATATAHLLVRVGQDAPPEARANDDSWKSSLARKLLPAERARSMIADFLAKQLQPLPTPATKEEWLGQREALRGKILEILGLDDLLRAKSDLAMERRGTLARQGYHIEKITYQSYPGLAVPALIYVPEGIQGPFPAMVSISGHTPTSKAAEYVQQRNVNLALRGCVVLSYDYHGFGERKTGSDPNRSTDGNSHGIRSFSYSRRSSTALEVLDTVRAVDVLAARSDVDAERIGFTGESGGGNSTYWAGAVDPRLKLVVPVSSVTTFDYWIRTDVNWDWHQRPTGIRRIADIGTLLALHAPDPLLIISSRRRTDDGEFPLEEAEKSHQWAKKVYGLLDAESAISHYESSVGHGYQVDKRRQLYRAVEYWLKPPRAQGDEELPTIVESLEDLNCGLPADNLTDRDVFDLWLKDLPKRAAGNGTTDASDPRGSRDFLRQRLGWVEDAPRARGELLAAENQGAWSAEYWLIETEPGIQLPAIRLGPRGFGTPLVVIPGRDESAVARGLDSGRQVLVFDPRGTGEMRVGDGGVWSQAAGEGWSELLGQAGGSFSNWAWFAGRPWPGMWAQDLVQVARFCQQEFGAGSISVDAQNEFGWSALLACAAQPDAIDTGRVQLRFASLHDDLRERGDRALADVPGILEQLDVEQIRALCAHVEVSFQP